MMASRGKTASLAMAQEQPPSAGARQTNQQGCRGLLVGHLLRFPARVRTLVSLSPTLALVVLVGTWHTDQRSRREPLVGSAPNNTSKSGCHLVANRVMRFPRLASALARKLLIAPLTRNQDLWTARTPHC